MKFRRIGKVLTAALILFSVLFSDVFSLPGMTEYIQAATATCSHTYGFVIKQEPTCQQGGWGIYACTKCGQNQPGAQAQSLAKVPHTYSVLSQSVAGSNCKSTGYDVYKCKWCTATTTRSNSKYGSHNYTWVEVVSPTCAKTGRRDSVCSYCGNVNGSATLDKVPNHESYGFSYHVSGSCTQDDYDVYGCSACGFSERKNVTNAPGHNMGWVTIVEPTCAKEGRRDYKCSRCGYTSDSKSIDKVPDHKMVKQSHVSGSCTKDDYDLYKCSVCGFEQKKNVTKAPGHNYKWVEVVKPTCAAEGRRDYKCTVCGNVSKSESIAKVPDHQDLKFSKHVDGSCTKSSYDLYKCSVCGCSVKKNVVKAPGHDYKWVVVIQPTCTQEGRRDYKCTACGNVSDSQSIGFVPDHTLVVTRQEPTQTEDGYEKKHCKYCSYVVYEKVLPKLSTPSCAVTFDANGGKTPVPDTLQLVQGKACGTLPTSVRTGYDFDGWYTGKTGGTKVTASTKVPATTKKTLYAHWTAKTYTVTYKASGATNVPTAQTKTYGKDLTLSSVEPKRTGYNFLGWALKSGSSEVTYTKGATFKRNADTTLYAVWELKDITITFDANGGTGAPAPMKTKWGAEIIISGAKPKRDNYTFKGWSTSKTATSASYKPATNCRFEGNVTLYAVWKAGSYTVTFDANGGKGGSGSLKGTYGKKFNFPAVDDPTYPAPSRTGYTFDGWSTSKTATKAMYTAGKGYMIDGNTTVYAVWKPREYKVTFNANGGQGAPAAQTKKYGIDLTLTKDVPYKTGYTCIGWATTTDAKTAEYKKGGTYSANKKVTLYAVWKLNEVTVNYNANGGYGAPRQQTVNAASKLWTDIPKRPGYQFAAWNTAKNGSGTFYLPGASASGLCTKDGEKVTLYAIWSPLSLDSTDGGYNYNYNKYVGKGETKVEIKIPAKYNGYYRLNKSGNPSSVSVIIQSENGMQVNPFEDFYEGKSYYKLETNLYKYYLVIKNTDSSPVKVNVSVYSEKNELTGLNGQTSVMWIGERHEGYPCELFLCANDVNAYRTAYSFNKAFYEATKSLGKYIWSFVFGEGPGLLDDYIVGKMDGISPIATIAKLTFKFFKGYDDYSSKSGYTSADWLYDRILEEKPGTSVGSSYLLEYDKASDSVLVKLKDATVSTIPGSSATKLVKELKKGSKSIVFSVYNYNYGVHFSYYYMSDTLVAESNALDKWDMKSIKIRPGALGRFEVYNGKTGYTDTTWMDFCSKLDDARVESSTNPSFYVSFSLN